MKLVHPEELTPSDGSEIPYSLLVWYTGVGPNHLRVRLLIVNHLHGLHGADNSFSFRSLSMRAPTAINGAPPDFKTPPSTVGASFTATTGAASNSAGASSAIALANPSAVPVYVLKNTVTRFRALTSSSSSLTFTSASGSDASLFTFSASSAFAFASA
jgi:hypothetical protein